ncbi:hypothetical protein ACRYI5_06745 [Furfurilactobacillus sp. WILCCON 0119]
MKSLKDHLYRELVPEIIRQHQGDGPVIIGITGNIASGKTTCAAEMSRVLTELLPKQRLCKISTDDFLMTNKTLREQGLFARKGFPETYDVDRITAFKRAVSHRQNLSLPVYDHQQDDLNKSRRLLINCPDIIILEGLMVLQPVFREICDETIFLETTAAANFQWYLDRCVALGLPAVYQLEMDAFTALATKTWHDVNVKNFEENVEPLRQFASINVQLAADHRMVNMTVRHPLTQVQRQDRRDIEISEAMK